MLENVLFIFFASHQLFPPQQSLKYILPQFKDGESTCMNVTVLLSYTPVFEINNSKYTSHTLNYKKMSRLRYQLIISAVVLFIVEWILLLDPITAISHVSNIPYHELTAKLKGQLISSTESNSQLAHLYNESIYIDNGSYQIRPRVVVLPLDVRDVQETVKFASKYQVQFSAKCGGHSAVGYSLNPELVLDMRYFNKTQVIDTVNGIAYIEAGLQWNTIYPALAPFVPVAGTCPHVCLFLHLFLNIFF